MRVLAAGAGLTEEAQEQILRDATCALVAAVYTDGGIAAASAFTAEHVFPALLRLRETVRMGTVCSSFTHTFH